MLALLLVGLYGASASDVGWVLAVYNVGGFVAALVVPALADRTGEYLLPLLGCGVLTLLLAGALALTSALPWAVVALIVLGGPAGVGTSLLFAELRHSGAGPSDVITTRAVVSFAWVAGPPVATLVMGAAGDRAILPVLAVVAVLNIVTTVVLLRRRRARRAEGPATVPPPRDHTPIGVPAIVLVVAGFVALQATNSAAVSVMGLFVTRRLDLPLYWSGIALGLSALLEIPALVVIGRLARRVSPAVLIVTGCLAGLAYYATMTVLAGPVALLAVQPLNAWFFGVVAGVGLTYFQDVIPRPGFASGLFTNTRRVGAIVSGPIIGLGASGALGYGGVFLACAVVTVVALGLVIVSRRLALTRGPRADRSRPT